MVDVAIVLHFRKANDRKKRFVGSDDCGEAEFLNILGSRGIPRTFRVSEGHSRILGGLIQGAVLDVTKVGTLNASSVGALALAERRDTAEKGNRETKRHHLGFNL
jgi:hypothetical protein